MLKMTIDNEEVVSKNNFTIKEEMLSPSSTILNNTYPKSWEDDKNYTSRFYYPKDYAKLDIQNFSITPEEAGTTIDINGSATLTDVDTTKESRVLSLKGQTSQTGTPTPDSPVPVNVVSGDNYINICGKNLFKEWLSGTVNVSTGEITSTARNRSDYIKVQPSTTYTLWREDIGFATYFIEYSSNKEYIREQHIASTNTTGTFTTSANTGYVILYQYTSYAPTNKAMLEVGSTATTYEPYIGNSYPIYLGVENLLDISSLTTKTSNGLTITRTNDEISITGTRNATGWVELVNFTLSIGTYTFSFITSGTNPVEPKVLEGYTQKANTFTVSDSTQTYRIAIAGSVNDAWNCVIKLQIEKGLKANSYNPYGTTPLELCKIGDYQDYIYKDNGSWYLHKEIGKVVLDGSETWTFTSNGNAWYISGWGSSNNALVPANNDTLSNSISNYFVNITRNQVSSAINGFGIASSSALNIKHEDYATSSSQLSDFTTWLSANKPSVYYILATPTTTEITDTTLLEQLNDLESQ